MEQMNRMRQSCLSALVTALIGISANGTLLLRQMSISEDIIAKERHDPGKLPSDMLPHTKAAVRLGALMVLNDNVEPHPNPPAGARWFYVRQGDWYLYP
jgi:hypothetical protein